jgi:hypothetical protein
MQTLQFRRMFAVVFIFGVALLLGSAIITQAQEDLDLPAAVGDVVQTPSTTHPYCVRFLVSNSNVPSETRIKGQLGCYRTIAEENAYRDSAVNLGWKGLGLIYRQTNFGTGSGYLRYMGQRKCVAGSVSFSQANIPDFFSDANLKSARATTANCEDVKLWEGDNFVGTSIDCVPTSYCPDLASFTMASLRFKD